MMLEVENMISRGWKQLW